MAVGQVYRGKNDTTVELLIAKVVTCSVVNPALRSGVIACAMGSLVV